MYSKEILSQYIEKALYADVPNRIITELISEIEIKKPIMFDSDEINDTDLPNYLEDNDLFIDNPAYNTRDADYCDFNLFNSSGTLILSVNKDKTIIGRNPLPFIIPFSNKNEYLTNFIECCYRLQQYSTLKFPKIVEE